MVKKLLPMLLGLLGLATAAQAQTCSGPLGVTVTGSTSGLPLGLTLNPTQLSCNAATGAPTGAITAVPTNGSPGYTYIWSTGANTAAISALAAGTYTVTVTDAHACSMTASTTLIQPTTITPAITAINLHNGFGISCALASTGNASNGELSAAATGGTGTYTYSWSSTPAQTSAIATGLPFGTYTVTVTDGNGCTAITSGNVTKPADFTQTNSLTQPACNNANTGQVNGTATIVAAGGVTTYSYAWATAPAAGQTTATATNLGTGTYTVTATDANSCTVTASYTLTEPTPLAATFAKSNYNGAEISCTTGQGIINNGTLQANVSGGTTTYSYAWNTGGATTAQQNTGLIAGTYTVTVTDANSCTASFTSSLTAPTPIAAPGVKTDLSCNASNGAPTGAVDLSATPGTGALSYSWSNSATTADLTALPAGTYTVTVSDANGCTTTNSFTISTPAPIAITLTPTLYNSYGISCALSSTGSNANGSIAVSALGGSGTISFAWNNSQTGSPASNLTAGTYTVTATDVNSCTASSSYAVVAPAAFTQTNSFTQPLCAAANGTLSGAQGGTATITPAGGVTAYSYAWGGTTGSTGLVTGLSGGAYTVTVTDLNGCTLVQSYTLAEPAALTNSFTLSNHNGAHISCATSLQGTVNDGSITAAAGGGAATINNGSTANTYAYNWGGGVTTAANPSLTAGSYTVTITDGNACSMTASATLVAPTAISAPGAVTNLSCNQTAGNGGATGAVDLSPAGGTGTYSYSWAAGGQTSQDISSLTAATYTVTVTDLNGCTFSAAFTISQPAPITFTTSPSNFNGFGVSCNTGLPTGAGHASNISNNGTITVNGAAGGNGVFTYNIAAPAAFQSSNVFNSLTPNTYTVTVQDGLGCTATRTQAITQPTLLVAGTCTAANDQCQLNAGEIKVQVADGVAPYSVTWTAVGTACQGSPSGTPGQTIPASGGHVIYTGVTGNCTYNFVVTDANGCTLP